MTPEERQLVTDLFDRLATLEDAPRDPEAERVIRDGQRQAPNAVYALVQTVLVQDEALRNANARIQELEGQTTNEPPRRGGFLDNMRESIFGPRAQRGSVPTVKPGDAPMGAPPGYGSGTPMGAPGGYGGSAYGGKPGYGGGYPPPQMEPTRSGGGSFLGTAAAAAAGVIGGSLLLDSIRSMSGGRGFGLSDPAAAAGSSGSTPWGASGGGNDELARQAGLDDIGRGSGAGPFGEQRQGMFDSDAGDVAPDAGFDPSDVDPGGGGEFDVGGGGFDGGGGGD